MTRIDVAVVAYGDLASVWDAVASVRSLPELGEIVVVDHNESAEEGGPAPADIRVVVDRSNPGFGAGQNRGMSLTSAPYVLCLNPDASVEPDAVARGAALLDASPDVAAVQGTIRDRATGAPERSQGVELTWLHLLGRALALRGLLRSSALRRLARRSRTLRDHADRVPECTLDVETLAATAVLVRRSAFDSVGGFDDDFFLYGEDLDLCRRLRGAGWRLVAVPETWAHHTSGSTSGSTISREVAWWGGTLRFAAKWWSRHEFALACAAGGIAAARHVIVCWPRRHEIVGAMVRTPLSVRRGTR